MATPNSTEIDAIDRLIISALRRDGRASFASIGTEIGLTEAAVRARYNRLRDANRLSVVAMVDSTMVGFLEARVLIRVRGVPVRDVAERLAAHREVLFVAIVIGEWDILADVRARNLEELGAYLSDRVRRIRGVDRVESVTVLGEVKSDYSWQGLDD